LLEAEGVGQKNSHLAFAGSGSLPLTAIYLSIYLSASTTCIDCDQEAVRKSRDLIQKCEKTGVLQPGQIIVEQAAAQAYDYAFFNTVFVASLIPNESKLEIARAIPKAEQTPAMVVRSVFGLGELVYSSIFPESLQEQQMTLEAEMLPQ